MVGSKLKTNKVSERKEALLKCYSDVVHYLTLMRVCWKMLFRKLLLKRLQIYIS